MYIVKLPHAIFLLAFSFFFLPHLPHIPVLPLLKDRHWDMTFLKAFTLLLLYLPPAHFPILP